MIFHRLSREDIGRIVDLQVEQLAGRVRERGIEIELTDDARTLLGNLGYDPTYGARPLKRVIQKQLVDKLALKLLEGEFAEGDVVGVDATPTGSWLRACRLRGGAGRLKARLARRTNVPPMRIGICAYWFNRGQGVVARQIRSALDELGHETFVLARRPGRRTSGRRSSTAAGSGTSRGSRRPRRTGSRADELVGWGREHELDLALFDQNYEFEAIEALRDAGVATVGRFVWEQFAPEHVEPARRAFETVYSLTACERERYARARASRAPASAGASTPSCSNTPPNDERPKRRTSR